jgi:hypothetical protein
MSNSHALVMIFPLFMAFPVALLTTFAAAVRAGKAPKWVLGIAAAALAFAIADPVSDRFATAAALLCLIAAAGALLIRPRSKSVPGTLVPGTEVAAPAHR